MELIYAKLQATVLYALDGVVYFIIAMAGASFKDMYISVTTKQPIRIYRIFAAASLATVLMYGIRPHVQEEYLPAVNFVLGIIGFELFIHISTIAGLKKTIEEFRALLFSLFKGTSGGEDPRPKKTPARRTTKKDNPPVQKAKEIKASVKKEKEE